MNKKRGDLEEINIPKGPHQPRGDLSEQQTLARTHTMVKH